MKPQLLYVAAKALIFENDELLLVKKRSPSFWDLPGGRIDPRETIIEAFKREIAEELPDFTEYKIEKLVGARLKDGLLKDGYGLFLVYLLVTSTSKQNKFTLSREHEEHRFFGLEEIDKLEHPLDKVYGGLVRKVRGEEIQLNDDCAMV